MFRLVFLGSLTPILISSISLVFIEKCYVDQSNIRNNKNQSFLSKQIDCFVLVCSSQNIQSSQKPNSTPLTSIISSCTTNKNLLNSEVLAIKWQQKDEYVNHKRLRFIITDTFGSRNKTCLASHSVVFLFPGCETKLDVFRSVTFCWQFAKFGFN